MRQECGPEQRAHDYITYNAVTRYVQRILLVVLAEEESADLTGKELAAAHCDIAGTTVEAVTALIATSPAIITARRLRVNHVGTATFRACLQDGVVTTIMEPFRPRQGGYRSEPSRNEIRRRLRREARSRRDQRGKGGGEPSS